MRQVINVWLENKPGALMRVVGVLTATGTNIERLLVTANPHAAGTSIMTIVAEVEPRLQKGFIQKINRLVNVLRVADATAESAEPDTMVPFEWLFEHNMGSLFRVEAASPEARSVAAAGGSD
jgi:acetolactate synthase small subunit